MALMSEYTHVPARRWRRGKYEALFSGRRRQEQCRAVDFQKLRTPGSDSSKAGVTVDSLSRRRLSGKASVCGFPMAGVRRRSKKGGGRLTGPVPRTVGPSAASAWPGSREGLRSFRTAAFAQACRRLSGCFRTMAAPGCSPSSPSPCRERLSTASTGTPNSHANRRASGCPDGTRQLSAVCTPANSSPGLTMKASPRVRKSRTRATNRCGWSTSMLCAAS